MLLQQLKYFIAVAETGSLSAAANRLFVTQPNLSKSIANLEDEYKTKLFTRTARGMALTSEGNLLYINAKNILSEIYNLDVAFGLVKPEKRRFLNVASTYIPIVDFGMVSLYRSGVCSDGLGLEVVNGDKNSVIEKVYEGEAEIGFITILQHTLSNLSKDLKKKGIEYTNIAVSDLYANIGPVNPLYDLDCAKLEQIAKLPNIIHPDKVQIYDSNNSNLLGISNSEFQKVFCQSNELATINFLRTTDAVLMGNMWSLIGMSEFGIRTIKISDCDIKFKLLWIKRKDHQLSLEAQRFVDNVQKLTDTMYDKDISLFARQAGFSTRDFSYLEKI